MKYHRELVQDTLGNARVGVPVTVFITGTQTRPILYAADDEDGDRLGNPLNTDNRGFASFFIPDGSYDIQVGTGDDAVLSERVQLYDLDAFLANTTTAAADAANVAVGDAAAAAASIASTSVRQQLAGFTLAQAAEHSFDAAVTGITVSGAETVGDAGAGMPLVYDATVDAAYVAANPTTSFLDAGGRGFRQARRKAVDVDAADGNTVQASLDHGGDFQQNGTGAKKITTNAAIADIAITPNHFELKFDGTDETTKIQAMIDAGDTYKRPILLNGGVAYITASLNCVGKYVCIRGVSGAQTAIVAAAAMDQIFDFGESEDGAVFSPYEISGIKLDGAGLAKVGIYTRYRHHTLISACQFTGFTEAAIREKDAWNNRRERLVLAGSPIGLDLLGANNNSHFEKLTLSGATTAHVNIGNDGAAATGNFALNFTACDIEYGGDGGKGIVAAESTYSNWNSCYVGEGLKSAVIENHGSININGGLLSFDNTADTAGIIPFGGMARFDGVQIICEGTRGISNLVDLPSDVLTSGSYGRVAFHHSPYGGSAGGTPQIAGDILSYGPARQVFAARLGRVWTEESNAVTLTSTVTGNARSVTCNTVTGASPIIGLSTPITSQDWRIGEPLYLVVVYSSTQDLTFRVASAVLGDAIASLGTLPSTSGKVMTAVQLNVDAFSLTGTPVIEMFINGTAAVDDNVTLYEAIVADSRMVDATVGTFGNLYKC